MEKFLPKNEHQVERIIRVLIGLGLLGFSFQGHLWGYLGIIPLLTGVLGSCPIYTIFGFSTCPVKSSQPDSE